MSSTLTAIREDDDWVYVIYNNAQGEERHLRSKFLVGCDGKTGFTRKKYLEPRGITMDGASKMAYEEVWVALNWQMSLPTPKSHPDFPLWSKGYTPEQVFELFFPIDFRFLCNPERAAVCGRFGLLEDRLWRFEYVLKPGEVGTDMAKPQHVERIVYPYITHPGSRYGLEQRDLRYPTDCIKVLRCRPFKFSARSCNKWALDRVLLCGDSAHVFPPFGGQGIASGFRDAIGVAWRLALATKPLPRDGQTLDFRKLFLGWYSERKQQLDRSLEATVINGNYVTASNPWRIFVRDWSLWLVQLIPSWKRYVEQGVRAGGMTRYRWEADHAMFFLPEMGGGVNMRQAYCRQLLGDGQIGKVQFTDDAIYDAEKTGLFQLVAFLLDIKDLESAKEAVKGIEDVSRDLVNAGDTTFIILSISCQSDRGAEDRVYRLATGEEFVNDGTMCAGRPQPDGYDPYRLTKELGGKRFAILRPDRFVFASCNTKDELQSAASELVRMIG